MKSTIRFSALLLAALLAVTACSSQQSVAAEATPEIVSVGGITVERGTLEHRTSYSGRVAPAESVYIIGKVSGTVSKTYFEVGDTVKAGDLLYEIDPVDIMLSVNQARAAYNAAAAQVEAQLGSAYDAQVLQAESAQEQARIGYKAAREAEEDLKDAAEEMESAIKAARNVPAAALYAAATSTATDAATKSAKALVRAAGVSVSGYSDADDFQDAVVAALQAKSASLDASYEQAKTARKQAGTGLDTAIDAADLTKGKANEQTTAAANASLQQAKAALDAAQAQVNYCKVTTPISGTVELKNVDVNGMSTPSTPAYVISDKDTMQVTFGVPAETARKLKIGDTVTVENGRITHSATVVEIAEMISQQSGLFPVKVNVTDDCADLLTGIAVKLTAVTDRAENALLVPTSSIYYDDGASYVYVVKDGTAVKTFVETGIFADDKTEITGGLSAGDVVVTTWDAHLRNGALVSVKEG